MSIRIRSFYGLLLAASLVTLPAISACSSAKPMRSSTSVPASEGTVRATAGADGNTDVQIRVMHLASPEKVQSGATTYVVWFRAEEGASQNVGAMTVDSSLEGRFDGSTPHRTFQVSVTPEASAQAAYPTNAPVFTSNVDRRGN